MHVAPLQVLVGLLQIILVIWLLIFVLQQFNRTDSPLSSLFFTLVTYSKPYIHLKVSIIISVKCAESKIFEIVMYQLTQYLDNYIIPLPT